MSVCLSARISQKQDVQTSRNFLCVLPVAMARFSADDSANTLYTSGFVDEKGDA